MKYGDYSPIAQNLVNRYKEVQKKLAESEDQGYAPHYVLDLLKDVAEMRSKIDLKSEISKEKLDDILLEYTNNAEKISTQLSPRLKSKSKNSLPVEYFSRNPALYINQFISDAAKFNHSTYIDRAYIKGIRDLSDVVFKNPGDKSAEAANMYRKYLESLYADTKGSKVEGASTADNLHRFITAAQFVSKLGFNTRSPFRNLSQSLFTWKWFGKKGWADALVEIKDTDTEILYKKNLEKYGLKFYDLGTITEGAITESDLINFGIQHKNGYLTRADNINILDKMAKAGIDIAATSGKFMQWAENINRRLTFKAAFGQRMIQLKQQTRFSDYSDPKIQEQMGNLAGKYAARVTELLHYQYGRHGKSDLLKSKVGSVMFQFQHYAQSTINLQSIMLKDYKRAFKAGDYFGYEAQRLGREAMLFAIANAISIPLGVNMTSYFGNEILGRIMEFHKFITGDEEEQQNAFYGKGPIVSQSVVLSDMVEIMNLGMAAGYWNMDADNKAALLMGLREYEDMDDKEFAQALGGMAFSEGERFFGRTIPSLWQSGIVPAFRTEFGLYPGETEMGINVGKTRRKLMKSETMKNISKKYEQVTGKPLVKEGKLKPNERNQALKSLARF